MAFLKKYKGFTIIETIVALVITMVCVGVAFTIMLNVEKSGNNYKKIQAHLYLLKELNRAKEGKKYIDENIDKENVKLVKRVIQYENIEKLYQLKITAFDNEGKKIDEVKELIIIDE